MSVTTLGIRAAAAALLITARVTSPSQATSDQSCAVTAEPSRRLELPDGRIVSIDVKTATRSAESILVLGRHIHVFPPGATPTTSPLPIDSTIGVIIDRRGVVRLVASPLGSRSVSFARAAPGPSGSFHVLFATGVDSLDQGPMPGDTATIWYARFENGAWKSTERVTATLGASLNTEFTSDLLERDGSLTIVFAFIDGRNDVTSGGLIALRRRNGRWSSDTMRTHRTPSAVRARHRADGALQLLFSQLERGAHGEDVYLTRLGDPSAPPRISTRSRAVSGLALTTTPSGMAASWGTWRWMSAESNVVEWARVGDGGGEQSPRLAVVDSGTPTYPFEFFVAGPHSVWLYHGEPFDSVLRYAVADAGDLLRRGSLTIPFSNPRARAVVLAPDRALLFTMKRGRALSEPMMASWTTVLRIRCPSSARR